MNTLKYIFVALFACSFAAAQAQGLDGIVVERYYQANAADVSDATAQGAVVPLTTSSVTYRVYVDMAAGYKFSSIYGSSTHNLTVSSTANFYNDANWGVALNPGTVTTTNIRKNTGMIDSWFTTGGTAVGKVGVLKADDTDGSLGNAQSILANNPGSCFGAPINGAGAKDGIRNSTAGTYLAPDALGLGTAIDVLDQTAGSSITITDGAIAALGGISGPTSDNLVLIGQFTTTGSLSFALNVQLISSTGVAENYVASSPVAGEVTSASLTQTIAPTCPVVATTDSPDGATLVSSSPNAYYPNCYPINGTTVGASDSPESVAGTGPDRWYRFVALSSGVSITLTSAGNDDVIELFEKVGSAYVLMSGGTENSGTGNGDFERLNFSGLTPGVTYYVSVGAAAGSTGGAFSLCIQHLMPGACAYAQPVAGFNLCSSFKSIFRGSPSQGVTYGFSFAGVGGGATGTTAVTGTNGLITLSNATLGLRYGGIYDVTVGVSYTLTDSQSASEVVFVNGAATGLCNDVTIAAQPAVEVRTSQRCPATLTRAAFLNATRVTGASSICGVLNYTYEFTPVVSCADGTSAGLAVEFTTAGSSPYLQLGVLPVGAAAGAWNVRVRPNFTYGTGSYGPVQRILVTGTAASGMLSEEEVAQADERAFEVNAAASIYPNPSNGGMIAINFTDLTSNQVQVRIMDAMGREVFRSAYSVEGSLSQIITFDQTLAAGLYMVEMTDGTNVVSERMIVKN